MIHELFLDFYYPFHYQLRASRSCNRTGVYEVHFNEVGVAEHGTAISQKRWDSEPRHDWLSAPTAPQLPESNDSGLHRPRSSTRLDHAPSSSALSTGLHPRSKDDSPPSSGSPVYSPILWVPDRSVTSSPEYSQPSWLSQTTPPLQTTLCRARRRQGHTSLRVAILYRARSPLFAAEDVGIV